MYPHERSLVEKYQGKPFIILGVNSDESREEAQRAVTEEKLAWPSFFDDGSTDGPIARQWNVNGWPTVYLIDHTGKIVSRVGMRKKDDDLIAEKVKEAESAGKK
jgi:glutathione peroxidase-family protein